MLVCFLIFCVLFSNLVHAQDITQSVAIYKQSKAEIVKIEEGIKQYKLQLEQINNNIRSLLDNKNAVQKEISKLQTLLNIKKQQDTKLHNSIKQSLRNEKIGLVKNLSALKSNPEQYNLAKSQIGQLSSVEKSINDINKIDKQLREVNRKLEIANLVAQNKKQNSANSILNEDQKINNIKSKLNHLKTSLGVN